MARIKYYDQATQQWKYADESVLPFPDGTHDGDAPIWLNGEWTVGSIEDYIADAVGDIELVLDDLIGDANDLIGTGVIE